MKAKSHLKKKEVIEAKKLYQVILQAFPKNIRAHQGLAALNKTRQNNTSQSAPQETINQLVNLYNQGKFLTVVEQAQDLTKVYPKAFIVWNILGASIAKIGKFDEAIKAYKKSISLNPDYAHAYNNMGLTLKDQGKLDEAIEAFNKSIVLKPNYAHAYNNMGLTLKNQGKIEEAIEAYNKTLSIKPNYAEAYINMGNALQDQGKLDEAIEVYKKALSLNPNNAVIYNNMGNIFEAQGKIEEAIEAYNKTLSIKPDYADTYSNIGLILKDQGKLDEAIKVYKKALSFNPNNAVIYNNMGNVFEAQGKPNDAIEAYYKSIALNPDLADVHTNLGLTLIKTGKLKEGLEKLEWRWKTKNFLLQQRYFSKPLWDGKKSLNGKSIFLWCEQGIGDTLNWSSYIPFVSSQANGCILECQEKLVPLLERSFPNIEVNSVNKSLDLERDDFDFHLPMGSIYKHFIHKIEQNNKIDAFLIPDPVRVNFWKERLKSLGNGPYIGICWKSAHDDIKRRPNNATVSDLYPILKLPNVIYVNLQYTDFANDITNIKNELGVTIHNFNDLDHFNNIDDVAALSSALDMVVSTKTSVPLISAGVGSLTKLATWKQSPVNNILLNPVGPSVDIYERDTSQSWDNVFNSIAKDILIFKNKKEAKK